MTATSKPHGLTSETRPAAWRRLARAVATLPVGLRGALLFTVVLHGCGLSWGMPASDAWDNDGVAPRDFLPGLAATYTPGEFYTYPPAHLALLAILTSPVTLVAVARAGTTHLPAVLREIVAPPYMTAMALTARIVSVLMSAGIVLALALLAEELADRDRDPARARRVGILTALFAAVGAPFTYYAHVTNLDVPSLFWATLAALGMVRALVRREPRRLRSAAVLAGLAVATKDQAYAMFLLAAPFALGAWVSLDAWARDNARTVLKEAAVAAGIASAAVLVIDGALFNPSGFRARLAFLSGSASKDFETYSRDLRGHVENFVDAFREISSHYPTVAAVFVVLGLVVAVRTARRVGRGAVVASLFPLAVALSFTVAFNMVARRVEERFTLPQMLFGAVYAGFGLEAAWSGLGRQGVLRVASRIACGAVLALGAWKAARVDLTMLHEPRYEAEAFLATHAVGETVEVHGLNVYLPRFPEGVRAVRVGPNDPARRGPLPGVEEVQAPYSAIAERNPRFVAVSGCWVWRFLERDMSASGGRIYPAAQHRAAADPDGTAFFRGLFAERIGYRLVRTARIAPDAWFRPVEMHGSLACPIHLFERQ